MDALLYIYKPLGFIWIYRGYPRFTVVYHQKKGGVSSHRHRRLRHSPGILQLVLRRARWRCGPTLLTGPTKLWTDSIPIGSIYGVYIHIYIYTYANIWGILMINVTIYSIHGSYGIWFNTFHRNSILLSGIRVFFFVFLYRWWHIPIPILTK